MEMNLLEPKGWKWTEPDGLLATIAGLLGARGGYFASAFLAVKVPDTLMGSTFTVPLKEPSGDMVPE